MRKGYIIFLLFSVFIASCSLGGDLTPPPALATSQAEQTLIQPTESFQPTSTAEAIKVSIASPSSEQGAPIYLEECAPCHGEDGLGDGPQADQLPNAVASIGDARLARRASPLDWFDIVSHGTIERHMPGSESLTEEERWDVVAYTFSLSSNSPEVQSGEEIFAGLCADCHGLEGSGSASAPRLEDFQWIMNYSRDDIVTTISEGRPPEMPSFADSLTEEESYALAEYIYSLSFPAVEILPIESEVELEGETAGDTVMQGSIHGEISNGSEGSLLTGDLEVSLFGFDGEQEAFSETTSVDENGEYQFSDVEMVSDRAFIATVDYQGVLYASEVGYFAEDEALELPITIFESTPDLTDVQLDRMHVVVDMPADGVLQVTELWILSNLGDQTISSETGEGLLTVQLPEGAVDLSFETGMLGSRFQVTQDGFIDLYPIRPGSGNHEIVFSFDMPFTRSLNFSQPISFPVEAVVMLSPEGIVELTGEGVQDLGLRQLTDMTLHSYSMEPMSPGSVLNFTVKRESGAGVLSIGSDSILEISAAVLIFVAAVGGTGFWLYRRRMKHEPESDGFYWTEERMMDIRMSGDREMILQAMADLDDRYEAGEITYAAFQKYRDALKERLMEIMRHPGND